MRLLRRFATLHSSQRQKAEVENARLLPFQGGQAFILLRYTSRNDGSFYKGHQLELSTVCPLQCPLAKLL